jgi:capsid protein
MPPRKKTIKAVEVPKPAAGAQGVPKAQAAQAWSSNFQNAGMSFARRAWYGSTPQDARKDVSQYDRQSLLQKARYAEKNFPSMVQYANDMVMYVVGDGNLPTSHAEDPAKGRLYEEYYYRSTRKADATGRYTGEQLQRIIVNTWAVDGEMFALKVTDAQGNAKTQLIEGHRVVNPSDPNLIKGDTLDGIVYGKYGEVKGIWIQFGEGQFEFKDSSTFFHIADFKRISGGHGLPPMAHALNSMQDLTEIIELEKRATKQVTDVPSILTKNGGSIDDSMAADLNGSASSDLGNIGSQMGGKLLVLEPGEDLKSVVPNFPRQSMEMFNTVLSRQIAAGGLPYEVVTDGSKAGSALVRMVLGKADRYVGDKQCMLHDCYLIPDWQWRIGTAIKNGELPDDPKWADVEFSVPATPSIDNGRDARNDRDDLRAGLASFSEIYAKRGKKFEKVIEQKAQNMRLIHDIAEKYGLPVDEIAMLAAGSFLNVDPKTQHNSTEFAEDEGEDMPAERGTTEVPEESDDMEDDSEDEPNS